MNKLNNKLMNFQKAIQRLKEAVKELKQENKNTVIRDGVIQRFEFTYELAWKTTKEYLADIGIADINSPKAVFKEAYAQKIIVNENNWLLMLKDRNITSHVYKEELAEEIVERIINLYVDEFSLLLKRLQY
jgi:nucleotidyltransferase substrate binding protein (TIGR01987 family)